MSTTAETQRGIRVSDIVAPDLVITRARTGTASR